MNENNKKILIVGLGLIGGSYARGLTIAGYDVYGIDTDKKTIDFAKANKIIVDGKICFDQNFINCFDRIIFAVTPKVFLKVIDEYGDRIKSNTIITDVTGVKTAIIYKIQDKLRDDIEFIGAHPMAGKEVYGIENSTEKIFTNANYIITPTDKNTEVGISFAREIADALKFRKISMLSPEEHDEMIAFLSQLTHCIAVSLMACKESQYLVDYTGDSFRDLTRIAKINENMWCDLFIMNKNALIREIDAFVQQIQYLRDSIYNENCDKIKDIMKLSTARRSFFDKNNGD